VSGFLSSPRRRRRLMRVGLVATVAGSAALVGIFFSNTGHKNASHFSNGRPQLVAPNPQSVPYTPREQREVGVVAQQFVATAVLRNHPERSYDLTDAAFHQGMTRAEWRTGNIPVVPYPRKALAVVKWKLDYSYKDRVGLKVSFQPKRTATVGGMVFNIELHRAGTPGHRRWLVGYWTPAGLEGPAPVRQGPVGALPQPRAGLGEGWLLVPVGLVLGLMLLAPTVLVVRGWRRRVQADRAYGALSER
jgi:hypothetical protein